MTVIEIPTPDPGSFDGSARPFVEALSPSYAVKKIIGRGGMGIVYLARDRRLDRLVAIKTLPPDIAADAAVRERFLRETRTAGAMAHPNIVPIYGAGEVDGHVYLVMSLVDGDPLSTVVRAATRLEPRTATAMLRDVAAALSHAHARGIIHRDIKAENILIDRVTGRALVTDFGIARFAEATPLTATGQLVGTVHYVSPEQVAGEPIDARSDIYSLGVVGFLALTGRFPFEGDVASAVLVAHVTKPAPTVASVNPNVPPALAAIVDRCLSKKPADRFATADQLLAALDTVSTNGPPVAESFSQTQAQALWQRAAELQALTGQRSEIRLHEVRAAATEAGIPAKYVDRALAEQNVPSRRHLPIAPPSIWAGAPLDIVEEVVVDGEIAPRDFERVLNTLRDGTARMGTAIARSRELAWQCGTLGHRLDASVVPDRGKTTIRVARSIRRRAATVVGLSLAGGGAAAAAIGVLVEEIMRIPAPSWSMALSNHVIDVIAIVAAGAAGIACIPAGRVLVRWLRRREAAAVAPLAEAVAAKVRESVAESEQQTGSTRLPKA